MTVPAHNVNQRMAGATRNGYATADDAPPADLFGELFPHLRTVQARAERIEETMHGYMLRRGPRTLKQLCAKVGREKGIVKAKLTKRPDLFRLVGRLWEAIPQEKPLLVDKRQMMGRTIAAQIDNYLLTYGPSTVREITDGIGHPDIRYVSAIIAKPPCRAKRIGRVKNGVQVWGVENAIP